MEMVPGRHTSGTALVVNLVLDKVVTLADWFGHPDSNIFAQDTQILEVVGTTAKVSTQHRVKHNNRGNVVQPQL